MIVAVTQCVITVRGERRDSLDQRWSEFLEQCGIASVLIPNNVSVAESIFRTCAPRGVLLTGGENLQTYGGESPERDALEKALLTYALHGTTPKCPVLGVCRGMEMILHFFGFKLELVHGHVQARQIITVHGKREEVNSFHRWGIRGVAKDFDVWGVADDGIVKAIRHQTLPVAGIMWHPERMQPFSERDIVFFRNFFSGVTA